MATGRKTGGRRRGTPNRATVSKRDQILASGMSPLDFMVSVFRDETQPLAVRLRHKIVAHTSSNPLAVKSVLSRVPGNGGQTGGVCAGGTHQRA